jgi:hypothetical protein
MSDTQSIDIRQKGLIYEADLRRESATESSVDLSTFPADGDRADHVDILGSTPLNEAILKIAAGRGDLVPQKIGSRILEYVEKMRWD